jgi:hypothetical protein
MHTTACLTGYILHSFIHRRHCSRAALSLNSGSVRLIASYLMRKRQSGKALPVCTPTLTQRPATKPRNSSLYNCTQAAYWAQ